MSDATIVLVHGAFSGEWIFSNIVAVLRGRGLAVSTADLPSCKATDASVDVTDDIAHVRELVDRVDGPVVLVGSSYGGVVITGVDHPNVKRLVYVAAAIPDAGEPFMSMLAGAASKEFNDGISYLDSGLAQLDVEVGVRTAFQQASTEDQDRWRKHASPMSFGTDLGASLNTAAWRTTPATYVVCTEDLAIDVAKQRAWAAERATETVEYPFDHVPGVSHPEEIADLLEKLAAEVV